MNHHEELEEGRVALHELEGQLSSVSGGRQWGGGGDDAGSVGSRPSDQVPRDTRLHYRQGSPLGLTLEELDDRGLLDGGGSVPNYYTSSRQRTRRPLEMKKRSSRLQERGKEVRGTPFSTLWFPVNVYISLTLHSPPTSFRSRPPRR